MAKQFYYDTWPEGRKRKKKRKKLYIVLALLFVLGIGLLLGDAFNQKLKVEYYLLQSPKITGEPFRVVLLSDLHNVYFGENQQELLDLIKAQEPDVVMLAGDMFDKHRPRKACEQFIDGLQGIPTYYVTGNHEYKLPKAKYNETLDMFASKGVHILNDEYELFTNEKGTILIGGIRNVQAMLYGYKIKTHKELTEIFTDVSQSEYYSVLMVHQPEQYERFQQYGFDLVVSGHTHGGQIRVPYILNGLYAPNQGLFPERAGGMYVDESMVHIVSRGLANTQKAIPRLWNPPEICVLDIAKG